jgi:Family of unknown function (DUF5989)
VSFKDLAYFRRVKWHPEKGELRSFAIAMLVGFTVLGGLSVWRHHGVTRAAIGLWGIGFGLALAASIPGFGRFAYLAVYLPTSFIGHFISKIVLFFVFFLVFVPIGVLLRLLGKDLLRLRPVKPRAVWISMKSIEGSARYYRQFWKVDYTMSGDLRLEKNPGFWKDLVSFLMQNKKWWLLPVVVVTLLVGVLIILGSTAAAPFIYTLF